MSAQYEQDGLRAASPALDAVRAAEHRNRTTAETAPRRADRRRVAAARRALRAYAPYAPTGPRRPGTS